MSNSKLSAAAENATLCFRTEVLDRASFMGQRRHDLRIGAQPGYVDEDRSHLNAVIYSAPGYGPESMKQKLTRAIDNDEEIMDDRRLNKTRARRLWRMAMLTFSSAAQEVLGSVHPDNEAYGVMRKFAYRHNIRMLLLVAHRDESAIHYHMLFENIATDGRALTFNADGLSKEQDFAAIHFTHLGILRGTAKKIRVAANEPVFKTINRSVRQLHRDLPVEIGMKKNELADIESRVQHEIKSLERARDELLVAEKTIEELTAQSASQKVLELKNKAASQILQESYQKLIAAQAVFRKECEQLDDRKALVSLEEQRQNISQRQLEHWQQELLAAEASLAQEAARLGVVAAEPCISLRPHG